MTLMPLVSTATRGRGCLAGRVDRVGGRLLSHDGPSSARGRLEPRSRGAP